MAETAKKRIVICADGTWNDPEDENPTNVLRMARAVKPVTKHDTKQVVFYDWGVGSYYAKVRGGAVGFGIMKNIPEAFDFYKKRGAKPSSQAAKDWRKARSYGTDRGTVDFIGVWDTVGALGIPTRVLAFMDQKDLFYDQELGSNVKVARHAVSIDERREDFEPTLWGKKEAIDIKQVWFAGVHSDVGGGYKPTKDGKLLSDIPLAWMATEASQTGLEFESHLYLKSKLDHRTPKHSSYKSFWRVLGKRRREIPVDSVMHVSVKKRFETMDYAPDQLKDWLEAHNGNWGDVEGI